VGDDHGETVTFELCSRLTTCCPEVEIGEEKVTITDDDGGCVRLTKQEFEILLDRVGEYEL
ncbi:MAG: hypothetical protein ABEJ65_05560, partial [bacterium]